MKRATPSYGITITWEEQQDKQWKAKEHTFRSNVNIGRVLLEMRSQTQLRNINLTKEV